MGALMKVLFCTALCLQLSRIVEAMDPAPRTDDALFELGYIMGESDLLDRCQKLDRNSEQEAVDEANKSCREAVYGFKLLVSNNGVPANWNNPCPQATEPQCRKLSNCGKRRCSVYLGNNRYESLRTCATGLNIPQDLPFPNRRIEAIDPAPRTDDALFELGYIMGESDLLDRCQKLDRNSAKGAVDEANKSCRDAVYGFNLLVRSKEVPANWRNPCPQTTEPECRKIGNFGKRRCSVNLGNNRYESLRNCATGLNIPQDLPSTNIVESTEPEPRRDDALFELGYIMGESDLLDRCQKLDRNSAKGAVDEANKSCRDAMYGFKLLVRNKEVPTDWKNPCPRATEPECRKLSSFGKRRCSVKLGNHYESLRKCATGLDIPRN